MRNQPNYWSVCLFAATATNALGRMANRFAAVWTSGST
jgi:hypothetical protein